MVESEWCIDFSHAFNAESKVFSSFFFLTPGLRNLPHFSLREQFSRWILVSVHAAKTLCACVCVGGVGAGVFLLFFLPFSEEMCAAVPPPPDSHRLKNRETGALNFNYE